jgi:hypothetical protein
MYAALRLLIPIRLCPLNDYLLAFNAHDHANAPLSTAPRCVATFIPGSTFGQLAMKRLEAVAKVFCCSMTSTPQRWLLYRAS